MKLECKIVQKFVKVTNVQKNWETAKIIDALRNQLLTIGYCIDSDNGDVYENWFQFMKSVKKLEKLI